MKRLPLLTAIVVSLLVFGPALPSLASSFLGIEYVDHYGTQWFYWYLSDAVANGKSLTHSDLFFFPYGKDIFAHTGSNLLDAFIALPFLYVFGGVLGYNLFVLLALAWSGWCFALLARDFTDDRFAVGVAALVSTFSAYALFELVEGRPTQAILGFGALFLRSLWRLGERPGIREPLLAGLWLALLGYQYWFYAVFFGLAAVVHGVARAVSTPRTAPGILYRHAVAALVAVTLVAPVALPMVVDTAVDATAVPGLLDTDAWTMTSTPPRTVEGITVGLFEWQPLRGTTGFQVQNPDGGEVFLQHAGWAPWSILATFALYLASPGRLRRGPTLAMVVISVVVALGPIVLVGREAFPNPPFIWLLKSMAFLRRLWWPARAFAVVAVLTAPMLAVGLAGMRERRGETAQRAAALGLVILQLLGLRADKLVPYPTWDATVPAGYRCLASGPAGAIIELPYSWTQAHLYYQTVHHRPMFGGMIENNAVFAPAAAVRFRESNTLVAALLAQSRLDQVDFAPVTAEDRQAVHDMGYRYVVLQRDAFVVTGDATSLMDNAARTRQRHLEKTIEELVGAAVYADSRIVIWAPWGDPPPCAPGSIEPDTTAVGRPDEDPATRVLASPDEQRFERFGAE